MRAKEFNRKAAESLSKAGAFDTLAERNVILENLDVLLQLNRAGAKAEASGQGALFQESAPSLPRLRNVESALPAQRLRWEKELLGLYVSGHPLKDLAHLFDGRITPIKDLPADSDYHVRVGGILTSVKRVPTRNQQTMIFATLEDQTGNIEVLVFPSVMERAPHLWTEDAILAIEGRVDDRDGEAKLICEQVESLAAAENSREPTLVPEGPSPRPLVPEQSGTRVVLTVPAGYTRETLITLKALLANAPAGRAAVFLRLPQDDGSLEVVRTSFRITPTVGLRSKAGSLLGPNAVETVGADIAEEVPISRQTV